MVYPGDILLEVDAQSVVDMTPAVLTSLLREGPITTLLLASAPPRTRPS